MVAYVTLPGCAGQVYLAREKKSGFVVAIKVLSKRKIKLSDNKKQVRREIEIQSHLRYRNTLSLGSFCSGTSLTSNFIQAPQHPSVRRVTHLLLAF